MTTPLAVLKHQADTIAMIIKRAERGEPIVPEKYKAKVAEARASGVFKFAIVVEEGIIKFELPWKTIEGLSETELAQFILAEMRR